MHVDIPKHSKKKYFAEECKSISAHLHINHHFMSCVLYVHARTHVHRSIPARTLHVFQKSQILCICPRLSANVHNVKRAAQHSLKNGLCNITHNYVQDHACTHVRLQACKHVTSHQITSTRLHQQAYSYCTCTNHVQQRNNHNQKKSAHPRSFKKKQIKASHSGHKVDNSVAIRLLRDVIRTHIRLAQCLGRA